MAPLLLSEPVAGAARGGRALWRRALGAALLAIAFPALLWWLWNPYAASEQRFDRGHNGLWIGHKWYTGRTVRSDEPVGEDALQRLAGTLARHRIRYAYVHVGPLLSDGTVEDRAAPFFERLKARTPDVLYLGWLGGIESRMELEDPGFRTAVIESVLGLAEDGFHGVQLNIEPLADQHPGYLDLLTELRAAIPEGFMLSHATRRAGPFGIAVGPLGAGVWSEDFYRRSMELVDQTVLMAYDTKTDVSKHYVGFVKHQTALLVEWACSTPGHQLLIGIPSYEDVPLYSNPEVENIPAAVQGVRAALEEAGPHHACFEGVAVYANWVTDEEEWASYREHWLDHGLSR